MTDFADAGPRRPGPLIALVGSDGSGKSTVGEALLAWMREQRPTELCHLGKQTGNIGRTIARWPLIGRRFNKALTNKADSAREPGGPGSVTASIIYLFSMRRVRRSFLKPATEITRLPTGRALINNLTSNST